MYYKNVKLIKIFENKIIYEDEFGNGYLSYILFDKNEVLPKLNTFSKFYFYQIWNEFEFISILFTSEKMRNIFEKLLSIKQIGLKSIEFIFKIYTYDEFIDIIKNYDVNSLTEVKGLGTLTAKIIIEELNKKMFNEKMSSKQEKVMLTLQRLGYKMNSIYKVLKQLDKKLTDEQMLSTSIRMLSLNEY